MIDGEPESAPLTAFSAALSAAIDKAEAHAQRATELGWPVIAAVFRRCRDELSGLIPAEELGR